MTKEEFNSKMNLELTPTENALINTNIYWNEKYIDYYINYGSGNYAKCWKFLIKNRNLLTIENTPEVWKDFAKLMIKNAKILMK